jgi:type IX secretion system PorP/SprF family membrane protein
MNLKYTLTLLLTTLGVANLTAQDIHFSQMQYAPITLNPALAGASHDMQAILNYKTQWKSVATPYNTINASFDMRFKKSRSGYLASGISVYNDNAGDAHLSTTTITLPIAYHLRIDKKSTVGGALYVSAGQRSINTGNLQWASQYNGSVYDASLQSNETFANTKLSFFDVGAGAVYNYGVGEKNMTGNNQKSLTAGIAAYHVNTPKQTFVGATQDDKLKMRIAAFATGTIGLPQSNIAFNPAVYYNRQGKAQELLLGSYVKYAIKDAAQHTGLVQSSTASLGVFYRNKDAVIVKGMYEYANYAGGVAYDFNTSSLTKVSKSRGGFELFIRYYLDSNKRRIKTA